MGYSDSGPSRCIVYEYMCNGTLEDWLEGKVYTLFVGLLDVIIDTC